MRPTIKYPPPLKKERVITHHCLDRLASSWEMSENDKTTVLNYLVIKQAQ